MIPEQRRSMPSPPPAAGHATLSLAAEQGGALTVTCRCGRTGWAPSEEDAWLWWRAHQATGRHGCRPPAAGMTARDDGRPAAPEDRLSCCVEVLPRETVEQAEARVREELAASHESVLASLARVLFGREQELQREEPWSLPCVRSPNDERGPYR